MTGYACLQDGCSFMRTRWKKVQMHMHMCHKNLPQGEEGRLKSCAKFNAHLDDRVPVNRNLSSNRTMHSSSKGYACLEDGCLFTAFKWKKVNLHMEKQHVKLTIGKESCQKSRTKFSAQADSEKGFPETRNHACNQTTHSLTKGYTCLKVGCSFTAPKWKKVQIHMEECHDHVCAGGISKARKKFSKLHPHLNMCINEAQNKKKPCKKGSPVVENQILRSVHKKRKQQNKKTKRKEKEERHDQGLLSFVIPFVNICFFFPDRRKESEHVSYLEERAENKRNAQSTELYWNLARREYICLGQAAGSTRDERKKLRYRRGEWCDFGLRPPLIYTHHAKDRLEERGKRTTPRFAPGTNQTVVTTVIPKKKSTKQEAPKRRRMVLLRRKSLYFEDALYRVESPRKRRHAKPGCTVVRKRRLVLRQLVMKAFDFVKSGSGYGTYSTRSTGRIQLYNTLRPKRLNARKYGESMNNKYSIAPKGGTLLLKGLNKTKYSDSKNNKHSLVSKGGTSGPMLNGAFHDISSDYLVRLTSLSSNQDRTPTLNQERKKKILWDAIDRLLSKRT